MHAHDNVRQTSELTYVIGRVNACSHLWKFATWRLVCRGLTVFDWLQLKAYVAVCDLSVLICNLEAFTSHWFANGGRQGIRGHHLSLMASLSNLTRATGHRELRWVPPGKWGSSFPLLSSCFSSLHSCFSVNHILQKSTFWWWSFSDSMFLLPGWTLRNPLSFNTHLLPSLQMTASAHLFPLQILLWRW